MYEKIIIKGDTMQEQKEVRKQSKQKVLQIPISNEEFTKISKDAKRNGRTVPKQVYLECLSKWINKIN